MPSDSVATFYEIARSKRLLRADVVDGLAAEPDLPQAGVGELLSSLEARGTLTPFQVGRLRAGRGDTLIVGTYLLVDEVAPKRYRAVEAETQTPAEVETFGPADVAPETPAGFVARAHSARGVTHPNLVSPLDSGEFLDAAFVAWPPADGTADLGRLLADIGPMPAALAARFGADAARGLAALHAAGLAHGAVSLAAIRVGPLAPISTPRPDGTPRFRPASDATARLLAFAVPSVPVTDHAGDCYALGVALATLLTGQPVTPATRDHLAQLRPDVPTGVLELVAALLDPDPAHRPDAATAAERLAGPAVAGRGAALSELVDATLDAPPSGEMASPFVDVVDLTPDAAPAPASPGFTLAEYHTPGDAGDDTPRPRQSESAAKPGKLWLWVGLAVGLQLFAVSLWCVYFFVLSPSSTPAPQPPKRVR